MNVRRMAILLASLAAPAVVLALGCGDKVPSFGYPGGVDLERDSGMRADAEAGPGIDLCRCLLGFVAEACVTCNKMVALPNSPCNAAESACFSDVQCQEDAMCVGSCITDAGADGACMNACLSTASVHYTHYLECTCEQCSTTCTSTQTCP